MQTYFAIPPPAHQRPVHDPGLRSEIAHGREVGFYEHTQIGFLIVVAQDSVGKPIPSIQHEFVGWEEFEFAPAIIMRMKPSMRTCAREHQPVGGR